tara:strand:- start:59 stop:517 length:459 start_codon:yes stop_codon:yes gene_type:complete
MLELTPEEILNEISFAKVGDYMSKASKDLVATSDSLRKSKTFGADDPRFQRLKNRGAGLKRAGKEMNKQLNNPSGVNTEEYQNVDEMTGLSPEFLTKASIKAEKKRGMAASAGNKELAIKRMKQGMKFDAAKREKEGKPDYSKPYIQANIEN